MKILLGIVTVLLVAVASGSGIFINSLSGRIDDLEKELVSSIDNVGSVVDGEVNRLDVELQTVNAAIEDTNADMSDYAVATGNSFARIEGDIEANSTQISGISGKLTETEDVVNKSVLQTSELYEKVKDSVVRITDGEKLSGSGFVLSDTGGTSEPMIKVVTAYHVIDELENIYVTLFDGRSWKASVFAKCEESDIVILNLRAPVHGQLPDASSIPSVPLGNSGSMGPGDPVFIIGSPGSEAESPLGLRETMNSGIISQVNRMVTIDDIRYANLLQFDAAANFGNSGGPLFNSSGEVVGVVVARINPVSGDGIGFAVTSSMVKKVDDAIGESFVIPHVYKYPIAGIFTMTDVAPKDIVESGNTVTGGVKVVLAKSPASIAGVIADDIIYMIDTREVHDGGEFFSFLAEYYSHGDTVQLGIMRNGKPVTVTVVLE